MKHSLNEIANTLDQAAYEAQAIEQAVADVTAEAAQTGAGEETAAEDAEEAVAALAPKTSPTARPRPARQATPAVQTQAAEAPEPTAAATASRVQIQLGAFVSQEVAAAQWAAIKGRNGDLLSGRARVVTSVQSGGRTLWRLRAGPFGDVSEASRLCRSLKARNEACIVARKEN